MLPLLSEIAVALYTAKAWSSESAWCICIQQSDNKSNIRSSLELFRILLLYFLLLDYWRVVFYCIFASLRSSLFTINRRILLKNLFIILVFILIFLVNVFILVALVFVYLCNWFIFWVFRHMWVVLFDRTNTLGTLNSRFIFMFTLVVYSWWVLKLFIVFIKVPVKVLNFLFIRCWLFWFHMSKFLFLRLDYVWLQNLSLIFDGSHLWSFALSSIINYRLCRFYICFRHLRSLLRLFIFRLRFRFSCLLL